MAHLSKEQLEAIQAFFHKEKTANQIAAEFGISRQAFYKWLRKEEAKEFLEELRVGVTREVLAKAVVASAKVVDKLEEIVDGGKTVDPKIAFAQIQAGTALLNLAGMQKTQSEVKHVHEGNPYANLTPEQLKEELRKLGQSTS